MRIDPIFFLHHAQIDRLWWLWQQEKYKQRAYEYSGPVSDKSDELAQLENVLKMKGLAPDIKVEKVMETNTGFLCYGY